MKEIKVKAIEDGSVIDHLPSDAVFKVIEILRLQDEFLAAGVNFKSKKMGTKGIVKVANKSLSQNELNKLAMIAPNATINIIKKGKVYKKKKVKVPNIFDNVVKCGNAGCITRFEPVPTKFYVLDKKKFILRCHHCEKVFKRDEVGII